MVLHFVESGDLAKRDLEAIKRLLDAGETADE